MVDHPLRGGRIAFDRRKRGALLNVVRTLSSLKQNGPQQYNALGAV